MANERFQKTYFASEFLALGSGSLAENRAIIESAIQQLDPPLSPPVTDVRLTLGGGGIIVEWSSLPAEADVSTIDALVASIQGVATTAEPFEYNSFDVSTSESSTPVVKISETTPPLEAGTYQVIWTSSIRMQAVLANTGVEGRILLTRSDNVSVSQDDAWDLANRHAYNGCITFQILAGQTIAAVLSFVRLGASGVAEMSGARVTIDKIS